MTKSIAKEFSITRHIFTVLLWHFDALCCQLGICGYSFATPLKHTHFWKMHSDKLRALFRSRPCHHTTSLCYRLHCLSFHCLSFLLAFAIHFFFTNSLSCFTYKCVLFGDVVMVIAESMVLCHLFFASITVPK